MTSPTSIDVLIRAANAPETRLQSRHMTWPVVGSFHLLLTAAGVLAATPLVLAWLAAAVLR